MSHLYRDDGVVLRTHKLGEADRIVVLMTKGRGKVRAVAKGVRKTSSRFGSRLEPTSHVTAQFYEGRDLDTVTQTVSLDHFRTIREDLERLTRATLLLELVDQVAQEGEANHGLYTMLVGALRSLADHNAPLLVAGFFWKVLSAEGLEPQLDECVVCGAAEPLVAFAVADGGVQCRGCRTGRTITPDALELTRMILGGSLNAALAEPASPATHEVEDHATRAVEAHLERRLRSAGVLDRA